MSYINFTYKNKIEGCLSNMSDHEIIWNKQTFTMGEAAFHYAKYFIIANDPSTDSKRSKELMDHANLFLKSNGSFTGPEYKTLGGKSKKGMKLTDQEILIWNNSSDNVQRQICDYKFKKYEEIKKVLLKTAGTILIHSCRTADSGMDKEHWCGRMTESGKIIGGNELGNIWMKIRDDYLEST